MSRIRIPSTERHLLFGINHLACLSDRQTVKSDFNLVFCLISVHSSLFRRPNIGWTQVRETRLSMYLMIHSEEQSTISYRDDKTAVMGESDGKKERRYSWWGWLRDESSSIFVATFYISFLLTAEIQVSHRKKVMKKSLQLLLVKICHSYTQIRIHCRTKIIADCAITKGLTEIMKFMRRGILTLRLKVETSSFSITFDFLLEYVWWSVTI